MPVNTLKINPQSLDHESSNPDNLPECPRKRIIVACDGTWMDSDGVDQVPSNITRIVRAIPSVGLDYTTTPPTSISQVSFYQNGIGTGSNSSYARHVGKYVSGATGEGLAANIREAYNFICCNYHQGDEIILLGFSRGAFTARSISTLIKQLGLLTTRGLEHMVEICDDWEHQLSENWTTKYPDYPWRDRPSFATREYHHKLNELRLTRRNIQIRCVGVWDTVGALGVPRIGLLPQKHADEFAFVDTRVEDNIEYAFHALGLDEKRKSYTPTVWFKPESQKLPLVLKQTWFPGVHSDIGGSYNNDDIANVSLAWMVGQLEDYRLVTFDHDYLIRQVHRTIQHHTGVHERHSPISPRSLVRAKTFGPLREWGLGKIHNSYTPFFWLGGSRVRTPMQHPVISRATRKPTGQFLTGTGEQMHASVRVRMARGGLGYDDKGTYESDALEDWKYEWASYALPDTPFQLTQPGEVGRLKNVEWVKLSPGGVTEIARMPEDKMSTLERVILRHWTAAEYNWEEGADAREEILDSARPIARETGTIGKASRARREQRSATTDSDKMLEKELSVTTGSEHSPQRMKNAKIDVGRGTSSDSTEKKRLSLVTNFRS